MIDRKLTTPGAPGQGLPAEKGSPAPALQLGEREDTNPTAEETEMSHRQLADQEGHRWDVEDQGPLKDQQGPEGDNAPHQLRFTRDDGSEEVREAPYSLDQMADPELRTLLDAGSPPGGAGG